MPIFDFKCSKCGRAWEDFAPVNGAVHCDCGGYGERQFSPCTNVVIPAYMRAEGTDAASKHAAWVNSPEVRAGLDSGKYVTDTRGDIE